MAKKYRFEMRLDEEYYKKLSDIAAEYGTTPTEAVRRAIDDAHEQAAKERRLEALRRLFEMKSFDDVTDPEELSKQLESAYDIPDPYRH